MMAETSSLLRRKKSTYVNSVITEHSNSKSLTSFMSSQDSGYIESQQTPSRNTEDTRSKAKGIGAAYLPVYPDTSPDLALSGSPAECGEGSCSSGEILDRKVSVFPSLLYETPKLIRKDAPFRRRLLLSSVCSNGSVEDVNTPDNLTHKSVRQWTTHEISNFEGRNCLYSFADSPGNENFDVIATSTLKTEEPVNSCNKWRLAFAQNRTSTIDESKCKGTALTEEVKFETPTQNSELESCSDPENPYLEIFRTPTSGSKTRSLESNFLTPVSSLAADLNFSSISTPPVTPVATLNVSTTEDSGFNSLGLDGSLDSYSDHEGSFQELACSYKETPKSLDSKRRQRKLERVKRLSTLRERGSQSETEEDGNRTLINDLEVKLRIKKDSITECDEPVFTEKVSDEPILKVGDLSRTPALQIIHDICLRSQKGHPQQHTLHSVLEYESRTKSCERVMQLAGLIGRKMGLEKLDIMLELKIRNLKHVISEILNTLSIEDICR
ncbi:F-box only protein 43-like [Protopterus annectens]|uniref:F-box only protein 43-like n=1 Tax=Protopterus annectens TaxID=7888 RepID=UPI001CFBBBC0|nr:F-box only protein 43-like [Protopterus annectens]